MGGKAQIRAMKRVAGTLRLDLAAYRDLEAFAQLGTELDAATQKQLDRGKVMVELLKQGQCKPMHVADQVISLFAGTEGLLDDVPLDRVGDFEQRLLLHVADEYPEVREEIVSTCDLGDAQAARLKGIVEGFKKTYLESIKR